MMASEKLTRAQRAFRPLPLIGIRDSGRAG